MTRYLFRSFVFLALIFGSFSSFGQTTYCTPSYSGLGNPTSRDVAPFYTHFLRVSLGDIDRITPAPGSVFVNANYQDFSASDTARLTKTAKYPISVELGNGANTQTFSVWIDYNQNGIFENTERVTSRTDVANVGDHKHTISITIPKTAKTGVTRMRIGTLYGNTIPDPCKNSRPDNFGALIADWSQHFQDYSIEVLEPAVQVFKDVSVVHTNYNEIDKGSNDNEIIRIQVNTNLDGVISPLSVDTFFLSLMGCSDPGDIEKATLYYTGKQPVFNTTDKQDEITKPTVDFKMTSTVALKQGANYFWLSYDVSKKAILGSTIDARCNGVHILSKQIPNNVNPPGSRRIGYLDARGNRSMFVYVRRVFFNTINLFSTWNTQGYSNYTFRSTEVTRGDSFTLSIEVGNGVNNSFTKAWIDFNGDGDFDDLNEEVLFDSITTASTVSATFGPVFSRFKIPANAKIGSTRMRIISASKTDVAPWKAPPTAWDKEVEIGEVEDYTIVITEDGEPNTDFFFNTVCSGDSTTFSDRSVTYNPTFYSINSWTWDFGDGNFSFAQNPKHKYAKPGVYKVQLVTNTNKPGTPDTMTKIVRVEKPIVDFSLNTTLSKQDIIFTDQTRGADVVFWEWNFGDPGKPGNVNFGSSPIFQYDKAGVYTIVLKVNTLGGCQDSIVKKVTIVSDIKPIANFNAKSFKPYKTEPIQMVDLTSNRPSKWTWKVQPSVSASFVNGSTNQSQNPTIAFGTIQKYTVTLVAENKAGIDSVSHTFKTKDYLQPTADFNADQVLVKAGQIVSFTDLSSNDPTEWKWSFGDGDSSYIGDPIHQYDITGKYTVSLKAENPAGNSKETKLNYIEVSDEYEMCSNDVKGSPLYSGTLYDSGGKSGNYGNSEDCSFLINPDCSGPITLAFAQLSMNNNDYIRIFDYDIDDGILTPLHTGKGFTGYVKPGILRSYLGAVLVEVESDGSGDSSGFKLSWTASANTKPTAVISGDTIGYVGSSMILRNNTITGTNNSYAWDTDNDGIDDKFSNDFVSVIFKTKGNHSIRLTASNCTGSDTAYFIVPVDSPSAIPTVDFFANRKVVYTDEVVNFFDLSTQGPHTWTWKVSGNSFNYDFVNGSSANGRNPQVEFYEPGFYSISLISENDLGVGKKVEKVNYILVKRSKQMCLFPYSDSSPAGRLSDGGGPDRPYISNTCNTLIQPCAKEVILTFSEFDYGPGHYLRVYDGVDNTGPALHTGIGFTFGDDPTSGSFVAKSGMIYIEHSSFGTNPTGFKGFIAEWNSVPFDKPDLDFDMPDTAYSNGNVVFFTDKTDDKGNPYLKWFWDFNNNGKIDDSIANPTHQYLNKGTYTVEMRVDACEFSDSMTKKIVIIKPKGKPVAQFEVSREKGTTNDVFNFTDVSPNGPGVWRWEFSPSNVNVISGGDSLPWISLQFTQTGTYDVKLYVSNNLGADSVLKSGYITIYEYCTPVVTNPIVSELSIANFKLGDIDNKSSVGMIAYEDFSESISTDLVTGGKYPVEIIRVGTSPTINAKIWIDFNQDGIFNDTLEKVLNHSSTTSDIITDTIEIPSGLKSMTTRLRVATSQGTDPNLPCGINKYGEYEDYQVVIGPDKIRPVITLLGKPAIFLEQFTPYKDTGATAFDNIDGDITINITTKNNVDVTKTGTYEVIYEVKDAAGNKALPVKRLVEILPDQTGPIITLKGDNPLEMEALTSFIDPGATAIDAVNGDVSHFITVQSNIDSSRLGSYTVIYSALDSLNNVSLPVIRDVEVVDTKIPVITLRGASTMTIKEGEVYTEDSADVVDNFDPKVNLVISGSVKVNTPGVYELRYNAKDGSNNKAVEVIRTVTVEEIIGIGELARLDQFDVFPNPTNSNPTIRLSTSEQITGKLVLYDVVGKIHQIIPVNLMSEQNIVLPLEHLTAGIYYIELQANGQSATRKVTLLK